MLVELPSSSGTKDTISIRRWIADMESAFRTSSCPKGLKTMSFADLLRGIARDWWEEIDHDLGEPTIEAKTYPYFVTRIKTEFIPTVEVHHLMREF